MADTEQRTADAAAEAAADARAQRRLVAEKGFYVHLATYAIVIGFLFLINAATGTKWWFYWPALGWGIGILVHAVATFGIGGFVGRDWEERRLKELIDEERGRR